MLLVQVVDWMQGAGIRPNVRTYTALVGALGRGGQWARAQALLRCAAALYGTAHCMHASGRWVRSRQPCLPRC